MGKLNQSKINRNPTVSKDFEFGGFDQNSFLNPDNKFSSNSSRENLRKSIELNHNASSSRKYPKLTPNFSYSIVMQVSRNISFDYF